MARAVCQRRLYDLYRQWRDGTLWRDDSASMRAAVLPTIAPNSSETEPSQFPNATNDPVGLLSCTLDANQTSGKGNRALWVRFRDIAAEPLAQVVFRGHYGTGGFDFVDRGQFAPGILVKHWIYRRSLPNLPEHAFKSFDERQSCDVVNATYANGTVWINPEVAQNEPPMPTPNPTGITRFTFVPGPDPFRTAPLVTPAPTP